MGRIGEVHAVQEGADAKEVLSDPVRQAVRSEAAYVEIAAWQLHVGFQDWVAAVGNVINGKVRPSGLGDREEVAPLIGLHSFVRDKPRGSVVQLRTWHWMRRVTLTVVPAHEFLLGIGDFSAGALC